MKTAAKVFIIIGMIFQFFLIYPVVIGAIAYEKLNSATSKSELKTIGIITTFFCSVLGGILMLCIRDEDLACNCADAEPKNQIGSVTSAKSSTGKSDSSNKVWLVVCCCLMSFFLITALIFSIIAVNMYYGTYYATLIVTIVMIAIYIPMLVCCFVGAPAARRNCVLSVAFLVLSLANGIFALLSNHGWGFYEEYYYRYGWHWRDVYLSGDSVEYWVIFAASCILLMLSIVQVLLSSQQILECKSRCSSIIKSSTGESTSSDKTYTKVCACLSGLFLTLALILSIIAADAYDGVSFVPLIITVVMVAIYIPMLICSFGGRFAVKCNFVLTAAFLVLSWVNGICAGFSNYDYWSDELQGDSGEYWTILCASCILFIISIVQILLLSRQILKCKSGYESKVVCSQQQSAATVCLKKEPVSINQDSLVKTNMLEVELVEVKRLYEKELITEEEYNGARRSIISKYYH